MSTDPEGLDAPSPRVLRLISKTFALWHDTWYYDRRQRPLPALWDVLDLDHGEYFEDEPERKKNNQEKPNFGRNTLVHS